MTYSEIEGLADLYEIPLDEQMVRWARAVAAAEREACAKIAEKGTIGRTIAKAIRERG